MTTPLRKIALVGVSHLPLAEPLELIIAYLRPGFRQTWALHP